MGILTKESLITAMDGIRNATDDSLRAAAIQRFTNDAAETITALETANSSVKEITIQRDTYARLNNELYLKLPTGSPEHAEDTAGKEPPDSIPAMSYDDIKFD